LDEELIKAVAKRAYEVHTGLWIAEGKYYDSGAQPWSELPASTHKHWKKIAEAVILLVTEVDCGDLVV
jgi:hypothetical protein